MFTSTSTAHASAQPSEALSLSTDELSALGFNSAQDYQEHHRVLEKAKHLYRSTRAQSIAAGSTAFMAVFSSTQTA